MAGVTPPTDSNAIGESRVIITSPEAVDMKQAVNDHFKRSIECAMHVLESGGNGTSSHRQWQGRKLPDAFSIPPSSTKSKTSSNTPLSHSRDGSTDSSGRYTLSPPATATSLSPLVQHSRTHSSPAIISSVQSHTNYSPSSQQSSASNLIQHQKHRSFDNTLDSDPSMQHLWQQSHYTDGGIRQQQQALCGEKTSKSLGDLVTPTAMGTDTGFVMGPMAGMDMNYGTQQMPRKISCNDPSMMWNEYAGGQNLQKPQVQFMRQQPRTQTASGGVQRQIMKRQQQQQLMQQQCHVQQMPPAMGAVNNAYASPEVQALNQERQRIYERNLQLRQQGLLDPLPASHPISPGNQYHTDPNLGQYHLQSGSNAQRTLTNPLPYQQQPMFHARQGSTDSGLEMQAYSSYPYMRNPSDIDLNFANISLDPSTLMDVDPTVTGPLDIAPEDLDQYLTH